MKNKDLDNFFRSRSNSFDEMPSDDLWKKIQHNLEQKPKSRFNIKKITIMALPIAVVITAVAVYLNSNNTVKPDATIPNNDTVKTEKKLSVPEFDIQLESASDTLILRKTAAKEKTADKKQTLIQTVKKENIQLSGFQEKIYSLEEVEEKPKYPGGIYKIQEFVNEKLQIPVECKGGIITLAFIIEKDGTLSNIQTVKGIGFGIADQATEALKESPKWTPGKQDGKAVKVKYILPITVSVHNEIMITPAGPGIRSHIIEEDNSVYNAAGIQVKPEFPGGMEHFYKFVGENYRVPKPSDNTILRGKIYVTFVVEKDGHLSDIKTLRDIGYGTGDEAVRVFKLSPKWNPGIQNGKPVRVLHSLPITIQSPE